MGRSTQPRVPQSTWKILTGSSRSNSFEDTPSVISLGNSAKKMRIHQIFFRMAKLIVLGTSVNRRFHFLQQIQDRTVLGDAKLNIAMFQACPIRSLLVTILFQPDHHIAFYTMQRKTMSHSCDCTATFPECARTTRALLPSCRASECLFLHREKFLLLSVYVDDNSWKERSTISNSWRKIDGTGGSRGTNTSFFQVCCRT